MRAAKRPLLLQDQNHRPDTLHANDTYHLINGQKVSTLFSFASEKKQGDRFFLQLFEF